MSENLPNSAVPAYVCLAVLLPLTERISETVLGVTWEGVCDQAVTSAPAWGGRALRTRKP